MDCNRDEATRAKELAEKKFADKDVDGAKKIALKAQKLYPELDELPQLLATLDVHISVGKRVNGVVDWYRVLGVEPLADDDTIRKHFRKLALILHPDKNKSVGAEGAFKILSEAWSLLSDKSKRLAYDQKRNGKYGEIPNLKISPVVPINGEKSSLFLSNSNNLNARYQKCSIFSKHPPPYFQPKPNTFWTTCNACEMHFEYLRTYVNHNLICPHCRQHFLAIETTPPPLKGNSSYTPWASHMQQKNSSQNTKIGNTSTPVRKLAPAMSERSDSFSKSGSAQCEAKPSSSAAQAAGGIQPSCGKLKRGREEAAAAFFREHAIKKKTIDPKKSGHVLFSGPSSAVTTVTKVDRLKKKRLKDEKMVNINKRDVANQIFTGNGGVRVSGSENGSFEIGRLKISGNQIPDCNRELSLLEIRNMLKNKAKKEIFRKLDEWSKNAVSKTSHELKSSNREIKDKKEESRKYLVTGMKDDGKKSAEIVNIKTGVLTEKSSPANSDIEFDNKDADSTSMSVPDPDFHDFDQDRTEMSFGENQVWAAYDEDDGMPRYYAMIHSVISSKPFKMRISWLNSKSNSELAPLNWVGSGFPKTSGHFWRGKYEVYNSLNSFSHKVRWAKGTKGAIQIYPGRGEVWALYRNWVANWNEHTPDEVIHKYDMVKVLEDYTEKTGVTVVPLFKVPGLKTVFGQHLAPSKKRTIPREEIFRFSHQVPSYLLTGQEGHNSPKGCLELDPASTPLELLQVLTEAQLEEMEIAEKNKEIYPLNGEQNSDGSKIIKEKCISEDVCKNVERKEAKEEKMVVYKRRR